MGGYGSKHMFFFLKGSKHMLNGILKSQEIYYSTSLVDHIIMHFLIYKNLENVKKIIVNKMTYIATDCEMRPLSFLITSPSMIG